MQRRFGSFMENDFGVSYFKCTKIWDIVCKGIKGEMYDSRMWVSIVLIENRPILCTLV
jgi:hypothetical protein